MEIIFDAGKDALNKKKHRISLDRAKEFDFESALYVIDDREDYGEIRYRVIGFLGDRLYVLVFADETDTGDIRAISLRKATKHEAKDYKESR